LVQTAEGATFFVTVLCIWKKKMFDYNYIVIVGTSLLNNAKLNSKYMGRLWPSG
jgi:hypothetical protein